MRDTPAARRERLERRLRSDVLARRGCLGVLTTPQRRVLVLRAGVGAGATRSRGAVARRLKISVRRVARLERSGLRRLRALCGAPDVVTTRTVAEAGVTIPATAMSSPPAAVRKARKPSRAATPEPGRGKAGSPPTPPSSSSGGVAGRSATNLPTPAAGGGPELLVPLVLLLLALAGFAVGRFLPRRQVVASAPPPPPAPPPRAPGPSWSQPPEPSSRGAGDWTTPPATPTGTGSPAPAGDPPPRDPLPSRTPTRRH